MTALNEFPPLPVAKVLLLEPHEETRKIFSRILTLWGLQVISVGSVDEVDATIDTQPDLAALLLRRTLHEGSVFEYFAAWKAKLPGVPAVLICAYSGSEVLARAREQGFEQHLGVPISIEELHATLARLLRPAVDGRPGAGPLSRTSTPARPPS